MKMWEYIEKRAATIKQLQTAYQKTVKPFAKKGTKGQNFLQRPVGAKRGGDITLSGDGFGAKSTGKLHRAKNLIVGLHEGAERASTKTHKGFMGHNQATIGLEDYLRINTLKGYTQREKRALREGLPGYKKTTSYGRQRREEARILGERIPEHKATFDALIEGKTHRADGTRLLNRHERKKINRAYKELQEKRITGDPEAARKEKDRYSRLEERLDRLAEKQTSVKATSRDERLRRIKKSRKLGNLWERIKSRHRAKLKGHEGRPTTDFRYLSR